MKKLVNLFICALLAAALLLAPVCACADASSACIARIESLQQYNADCLSAGSFKTQCGLAIVNQANQRIEQIVRQSCKMAEKADSPAEVRCIIASMLLRTSAVSKTAQAAAALFGVKTICEYEAVEIGGQTIYVDPLRVVRV